MSRKFAASTNKPEMPLGSLSFQQNASSNTSVYSPTFSTLTSTESGDGNYDNGRDMQAGSVGSSMILSQMFNKINLHDGSIVKIKLSHFKKVKEIGHGSFGVVYLMEHIASKERFAAKMLRAALTRESLKMIKRDTQMLGSITENCDFIAKYRGVLTVNPDQYWIFMDLERTDLGILIKNAQALQADANEPLFDEFVICRIAYCLASGMGFLKEKINLLHRDIKPSNILVSQNGALFKLCDFGFSTTLINSIAKTMNTGTVHYVAPEKVKANAAMSKTAGYNSASDVWSLGMMIFELVAGNTFFAGSDTNQFELLVAIDSLQADIKVPEKFNDKISTELKEFIENCLHLEPEQRTPICSLTKTSFVGTCDQMDSSFIARVDSFIDDLMEENRDGDDA